MTLLLHPPTSLNPATLESALLKTDPSALLVPAWVLRAVLAADCHCGGSIFLTLRVQSHGIHRAPLLRLIDQKDLPLDIPRLSDDTVILLQQPDSAHLASTPAPILLRHYWRLLYHARVYIHFKSLLNAAPEPRAAVQHHIQRIGRSTFNDARAVLHKDRLLSPAATDIETFSRFAAVFLELHAFDPDHLPDVFATIDDPARLLRTLSHDLDPSTLLTSCRPEGLDLPEVGAASAAQLLSEPTPAKPLKPSPNTPALLARAARAQAAGNSVSAAILQLRTGLIDPAQCLQPLIDRLKAALELPDPVAQQWQLNLLPILQNAAAEWWNPENRLLYDLQKVCTDHERGVYALNLPGFLLTLGRLPLQRPLPAQRDVLICKHLQSASRRLIKCRIAPAQRDPLDALLHDARQSAQSNLRRRLRAALVESLDRGGLRPEHAVERVAQEKLIEELLDTIVHHGYAGIGDLRDAISRNQLKLHDLQSPRQFLHGDDLLQVDAQLSRSLDGVYRRGAVYLRFFQRLSALLFATPLGRLLTYFALIPFGGSYLVLEALDHSVGLLIRKLAHFPLRFNRLSSWTLLGFFFLILVNSPAFRLVAARSLAALFHLLRWLLVGLPRRILSLPIVRTALQSRPWHWFVRHMLRPVSLTTAIALLLPRHLAPTTETALLAATFLASWLLLNNRFARTFEQTALDSLAIFWTRLTAEVLAGLFRIIVRAFDFLLEELERTLYAVDEWLRFRSGQRRATLALKAVVGSLWSVIQYILRFVITLLVEPQINPIKHFPVVTVSHKIILPTAPLFASALASVGFNRVEANTYAATIVFLIPGIFGFLAWELKENYRLYKANRPLSLKPTQIGAHGETLTQLLRPGFHSGTIPRLMARKRKTSRGPAYALKQSQALDHVREALAHFLTRDSLALLNRHPAFSATPVSPGPIHLAPTRIRIPLLCPNLGPSASLSFEHHAGWIIASIPSPGWMRSLHPDQAPALQAFLLGLYASAGIDFIHEQTQSLFAPLPITHEFRRTDLLVWPSPHFTSASSYELRNGILSPRPLYGPQHPPLPPLEPWRLFNKLTPLNFTLWLQFWDTPPATTPTPLLRPGTTPTLLT